MVMTYPADAQSRSKTWKKIDGCTLVNNEFNDGDSFHVKASGRERIFRLHFVDCPETSDHNVEMKERVREQAKVFNLTASEVMRAGKKASEFTHAQLSRGPFTVYTRWANAGGASEKKRFYAYIVVNGRGLDEILVENGWARVHGLPVVLPDGTDGFKHREKLLKLEQNARRNRVGVWRRNF